MLPGKPQFLAEHYARLENSLGAIGKPVPFSCEALEKSISDLAEEGQIRDHNIPFFAISWNGTTGPVYNDPVTKVSSYIGDLECRSISP